MAKITLTVNDDAGQQGTSNNNDTSASSYAFSTSGTSFDFIGFRFTGVTIPNAGTIRKATLKVHCASIGTSSGTFDIKAEAADNAAVLNTTNNNLASRTYTSALPQRIHDLDDGFLYFDVTSLVQTIINRGGWASGNALHLSFQTPWSSTSATVSTVESANDPQLSIIYDDTATALTTFGSNTGSYANPTNANADDAVYATTTNDQTATHVFYNFGFSIPAGATITDIVVKANLNVSSTTSKSRYGMEISKDGGTNWSTQKFSNQLTTTDDDVYWGGDPDGWSISPTASEINDNTNFRIRIQNDFANSLNDASLDYIAVQVFYVAVAFSPTADKWHPLMNNPLPEQIGIVSYMRLLITFLLNFYALSRRRFD